MKRPTPQAPLPTEAEDAGDDLPEPAPAHWSPVGRNLAMVLWPSFLAAGMATMFMFVWVDPLALEACALPGPLLGGRLAGYGLGFFFFWGITASASGTTLYLSSTLRRRADEPQ
ncbi:MAG: hypothetical protein RJB26_2540 [Pseudomonadota bacterium]